MARRVIRRRRPSGGRVVRRVARGSGAPAQAPAERPASTPAESEGSPVLMATSNTVRNLILPKLATISDIKLTGLADSPENALKMLVQDHPEAVIFDMDFGGQFIGLDTARMMQKTRTRAAIVMLVPELDVEELRIQSRRFGSSWSYVKKTTAARVDVLESVLKSAVRGVQWIEPELSRSLNAIWKVADEARELEAARAAAEPVPVTSPSKIKSSNFTDSQEPDHDLIDDQVSENENDYDDEDEVAPGIKTKTTSDSATDGLNITSVSVGHGGIGQNVGKIRRTG